MGKYIETKNFKDVFTFDRYFYISVHGLLSDFNVTLCLKDDLQYDNF